MLSEKESGMRNERFVKGLKVALPVIFILYFISITFFTHSHVVNGVTIVHSHPYVSNDDGSPTHEHTGAEIQLIQFLTTFHSVGLNASSFSIELPDIELDIIKPHYYISIIQLAVEGLQRLRPPPSL